MSKKIQINLTSTLTLEEALELFIRKCQIKNLTENTIKSYKQKFSYFISFTGASSVSAITPELIDSYILFMKSKGSEVTTINSNLRAIRAVLNFLMEKGELKRFPINLLKTEKKIKETYTEAELKLLLKKPNLSKVSFNEYKIWVLENYLLGTGNRISTALELKIKDIDFQSGVITLRRTKNRKQQIIPLSSTLSVILEEYLKIRKGTKDDYVFCNSYGGQANTRTIQQMVADYNIKRGVNKTSCHLFRHTFAKMYILNGGDAFRLQRLLGHSDITITKEYVNMFSDDLSRDYSEFNPLDNIIAYNNKKIRL